MQLIPVFQPILNVRQQRYTAAEALARWKTEDGQLIGPYQNPVEPDWIKVDLELAKLIRQSADACRPFFPFVFINVSEETLASDLAFKRWLAVINSIVSTKALRVVIEVVETVSEAVLQKRWSALQSVGAAIALDDFGDGRSTFSRLTARRWDFCKFSAKRLSGADGIHAVTFCQEQGITGVVEQVEDATLSILTQDLGLIHQQGYYHSRPALLTDHLTALNKDKTLFNNGADSNGPKILTGTDD